MAGLLLVHKTALLKVSVPAEEPIAIQGVANRGQFRLGQGMDFPELDVGPVLGQPCRMVACGEGPA